MSTVPVSAARTARPARGILLVLLILSSGCACSSTRGRRSSADAEPTGTAGAETGGGETDAGQTGGCGASCAGSSGSGGLAGSGGASGCDPSVGGGSGSTGGSKCGDGILDENEQCDDGNAWSGDGCNHSCRRETDWVCPIPGEPCLNQAACGNGTLTSDETCDDGNTRNNDGCSADCQNIELGWECRVPGNPCSPLCGDGRLYGSETCDDGNARGGDGCSAICRTEPGYSCPSVGQPCIRLPCVGVDAGGACDSPSPLPRCGDGIVSTGEQCDYGGDLALESHNDDDAYGGCTTRCQWGAFCGDGIVNGPAEECDLGPRNGERYGAGGCTAGCTLAHTCGDGILDSAQGEMCDLGPLNGEKVNASGQKDPCGRIRCYSICKPWLQ